MGLQYEGDALGTYPADDCCGTSCVPRPNVLSLNDLTGPVILVDEDGNEFPTEGNTIIIDTAGGGGGGDAIISNTLFVDELGASGSGTDGSLSAPYDTPGNAILAAVAGDTIHINPGTFSGYRVTKDGVNMFLEPGAIIDTTGSDYNGIIFDFDVPMQVSVVGGDLITRGSGSPGANPVKSDVPGTYFDLNVRSIQTFTPPDTSVAVGVSSGGKIHVKAQFILAPGDETNLGRALYWIDGGEFDVEAKQIFGNLEGNPSGDASNWYVRCSEFFGLIQVIDYTAPVAAALQDRIWITADLISPASDYEYDGDELTRIDYAYITFQDVFAYVRSMKIKSTLNFSGTNSEMYLNAQKFEACPNVGELASAAVINLSGGESWVEIGLLKDVADTPADVPLVLVSGGTHHWHVFSATKATAAYALAVTGGVCEWTGRITAGASGKGVNSTGGSTKLTDCVVDTSANSSTSPLIGTSAATVILNNTHLQAHSSANSIASTSGTLTVICLGQCTTNRAVGANVTIVGSLVINAAFTA